MSTPSERISKQRHNRQILAYGLEITNREVDRDITVIIQWERMVVWKEVVAMQKELFFWVLDGV